MCTEEALFEELFSLNEDAADSLGTGFGPVSLVEVDAHWPTLKIFTLPPAPAPPRSHLPPNVSLQITDQVKG